MGRRHSGQVKTSASIGRSTSPFGILCIAAAALLAWIPLAMADRALLQRLEGHWVSEDSSFAGPGASSMVWAPVLDGNFFALSYAIRPADVQKEGFSGTAHYRVAGDCAFEAYWADSGGDLLPITGRCDDGALLAEWGTPEHKQGRTRYAPEDDGAVLVTDWIFENGAWTQFSQMRFARVEADPPRLISGIGGLFFRGANPGDLAAWYEDTLGIDRAPRSYDVQPWRQEAGFTVFSAFPQTSDYFDTSREWMVNFRVRDLDELIRQLTEKGIEVSEPVEYPNGRFARIHDPEGNPIELWEPADPGAQP